MTRELDVAPSSSLLPAMRATPVIRSSGDLLADRRYAWAEAALAAGDTAGATDLLAQTIEIVPAYAPAWFLLARARLALDQREAARAAFGEALRRDPDDVLGAGLELARLGAVEPAGAMPPAYVRALFDGYAGGFDAHLHELGYRGPALIRDAIGRAGRARYSHALDLGCGTGLMGAAIRPVADRLAGCDLSPRMVEKARAKRLYDRLAVADIRVFLDTEPARSADLVLAADVLVYVGDLAPIFAAAARTLSADGIFAFTVQALDGDGFDLGHDLRFAHSESYVRAAAAAARLEPVLLEAASTRLDRGAPVAGLLALLRKA